MKWQNAGTPTYENGIDWLKVFSDGSSNIYDDIMFLTWGNGEKDKDIIKTSFFIGLKNV